MGNITNKTVFRGSRGGANLPDPKVDTSAYFSFSDCYSKTEARPCEEKNGTWFNQTCYNDTVVVPDHLRESLNKSTKYQPSPSEEYFK